MFKARSTAKDGKHVIFIGLSDENVKNLDESKPIVQELADIGFDNLKLVIIRGQTEQTILKDMVDAGLITVKQAYGKDPKKSN